jgi:hypothetical protein
VACRASVKAVFTPGVFAAPDGQIDGGVAKDTQELRASPAQEAFFARPNPLPDTIGPEKESYGV